MSFANTFSCLIQCPEKHITMWWAREGFSFIKSIDGQKTKIL